MNQEKVGTRNLKKMHEKGDDQLVVDAMFEDENLDE